MNNRPQGETNPPCGWLYGKRDNCGPISLHQSSCWRRSCNGNAVWSHRTRYYWYFGV